ncbi:hypothetical protein SBRCBS47491_009454 [Sporothrix bragantina]|uniref:Uncharacterized protein n=1 Tax=Sporothrix bragantina TaxID=671064 RepID=A0ABP0CWI3_9PEZI
MSYTGATAYRALVRTSDALDVNGMLPKVIFWHGTDSKWVYTCPLGHDTFETTCRIIEGKDPQGDDQRLRASWGCEASVAEFLAKFAEFCPPVQQVLQFVTSVQHAKHLVAAQQLPPTAEIKARIESVWDPKNNWIYHHEMRFMTLMYDEAVPF